MTETPPKPVRELSLQERAELAHQMMDYVNWERLCEAHDIILELVDELHKLEGVTPVRALHWIMENHLTTNGKESNPDA